MTAAALNIVILDAIVRSADRVLSRKPKPKQGVVRAAERSRDMARAAALLLSDDGVEDDDEEQNWLDDSDGDGYLSELLEAREAVFR